MNSLNTLFVIVIFITNTLFVSSFFNHIPIKKSNIIQTKINLEINDLFSNEKMYTFGFNENFDEKNFYFIIGESNDQLTKLIEDLEKINYCGFYMNSKIYKKKELSDIKSEYIQDTNTKYPFNNNFWIFDKEKYIGNLFEVYSQIFYELS